jgi:hypothetical protein
MLARRRRDSAISSAEAPMGDPERVHNPHKTPTLRARFLHKDTRPILWPAPPRDRPLQSRRGAIFRGPAPAQSPILPVPGNFQ